MLFGAAGADLDSKVQAYVMYQAPYIRRSKGMQALSIRTELKSRFPEKGRLGIGDALHRHDGYDAAGIETCPGCTEDTRPVLGHVREVGDGKSTKPWALNSEPHFDSVEVMTADIWLIVWFNVSIVREKFMVDVALQVSRSFQLLDIQLKVAGSWLCVTQV